MRLLLAPLVAALAGMALVAVSGARLTRLQFLGAAFALGAPAVGAMLAMLCMADVPAVTAAWSVCFVTVLSFAFCWKRRHIERDGHRAAALIGAGLLSLAILVRLLAVPAVRGDGLSMALLRSLAIQQPTGPWLWLQSSEAALLHPDYPLGVPALMSFGQVLAGNPSDAAALSPLLLALPGAALFVIATLARHSNVAAWCAAGLFALLPVLRTYASSGQADPLMAGVLTVAILATTQGPSGLRLALFSLLLAPFMKHEGSIALLLLGSCLLLREQLRTRLRYGVAALCSLGVWPLTMLLRGLDVSVQERLSASGAVNADAVFEAWMQVALTAKSTLCMLPFVALCACALVWRDRPWRFAALTVATFTLAIPLLLLARGTASEMAIHGDVFLRLYLQLAPVAIAIVGMAAAQLLPAASMRNGTATEP
ncbi:MAG: hypothetical protein EXS14_07100 [Planctomycetes bacterium]|nr:hypothetical protein [Planctomycetota bacterium]